MTTIVPQDSDPDSQRIDIIKNVVGKRAERLAAVVTIGKVLARRVGNDSRYTLFDFGEEAIRQLRSPFELVIVQGYPQIPHDETVIDRLHFIDQVRPSPDPKFSDKQGRLSSQ